MKATKTKLTLRQRDFIRAFAESYGNITDAANASGIPRRTFYNWQATSPAFVEACERIGEEALDFAETRLFELISKGRSRATIFYLKTRGKSRGY